MSPTSAEIADTLTKEVLRRSRRKGQKGDVALVIGQAVAEARKDAQKAGEISSHANEGRREADYTLEETEKILRRVAQVASPEAPYRRTKQVLTRVGAVKKMGKIVGETLTKLSKKD